MIGLVGFVPSSLDDVLTVVGIGLRGELYEKLEVLVNVDYAGRGTSVPWRWFREFCDRRAWHINFSAR